MARLVLRGVLGIVMIAHGVQKVSSGGLGAAGASFERMGIPGGAVFGPLVALLELAGGAAMLLGLLTPIVGALFALTMLGAAVLVHGGNGFYAQAGGYEFALVLAVLSAYLAVVGPGRLSVDSRLLVPVLRRRGDRAVPAGA
ncbi:DoxX family membrane protein [Naumannella cuiyingiana]|uniref:Putative oxidoreductase n=1 Tax=Naumannella cuiyingiana TaxID=1347891 RepID=A0A7Z0DAR3_9ACTN|nr:putative oxidoreductase [Naumannella cuiyingiana]